MRDPVLDRDMFRKVEAAPPSEGVVSLVKGESDYERRKKQAMEMLAAAKERQNPENYKTLSEQSRPGVFRPVATGQPQAPQPNTQQQMAQMQAMGFRPVGMADGGYVQRFAEGTGPQGVTPVRPTIAAGENAIYTMPDIGLRIGGTGTSAIDYGPTARDLSPARERSPYEEMPPIETMSDAELERLAETIFLTESGRYKESTAKTPIGRGLQSLNPFRVEPSKEEIAADLKLRRDQARDYARGKQEREQFFKEEEERSKAIKENPVASIFTEIPAEERARQQEEQKAALKAIEEKSSEPQFTASAQEGIGSLAGFARARAAARDVYEAPAKSQAAPKTPTADAAAPKGIATTLNDIKRQRETDRQDDINMALLQAGLAMAAGESPNALKNIAAGGISGLQAFSALQKDRRTSDLAERELAAKEKYYGIMESKLKDADEQRKARLAQSLSAAKQKGAIEAEKAYAKWLETQEGSMALPEERMAYKRKLEDQFTRVFFNDYTLGSGSGSSDPLSLFGE
jgi:hypothetical protein